MSTKCPLSVFLLYVAALVAPLSVRAQSSQVIQAGNARFTVLAAECVRLEYSKDKKFIDAPSLLAVNRSTKSADFKRRDDKGKVIIETSRFELTYTPDAKPLSPQNLSIAVKTGNISVRWTPGMKNVSNLGGANKSLDGVNGAVPLSGGLLSRDGWYFLDDSDRHLLVNDWVSPRPDAALTGNSDGYFFAYGTDYKAALKAFTAVAGSVPMPRRYTLGSWYSRYWAYSSKDYRQLIDEYQTNDFPLDVMVLDMDWHKDGWTGYSWNRKLLPDAEKLLADFHYKGLAVSLNIHPDSGVGSHEDMYKPLAKALGVKLPESGKLPVIPFDAGDKNFLDTLFAYTHAPREKEGVDFWWLDWGNTASTPSIKGLSNLTWLNRYYFRHTSKNGKRGVSFSRWGGWGDHKHPVHFSGDAGTDWSSLAFQIPFTAASGNALCFFWSHDIGGHWNLSGNSRNEEVYARWTQFGALSAALRIHSSRNAALDRRPWLYTGYTDAMRQAFQLRSKLFPYIYSSVRQSCAESVPLLRSMYIEYPKEEEAYRNPQQYAFGDAMLVAPITSAGGGEGKVASQRVWFPNGTWYNFFTGEKMSAGNQTVWASLDELPLYIKGGVPVPMQPYRDRMATALLDTLVVRAYPGEDNQTQAFTLYEDDGITDDYKQNKFSTTRLEYARKGDSVTVTIKPAEGGFTGQLATRAYVIELPCTERLSFALANRSGLIGQYDEAAHTNRISIPPQPIREQLTVVCRIKEIDYDSISQGAFAKRLTGRFGKALEKGAAKLLLSLAGKRADTDLDRDNLSMLAGISLYANDEKSIALSLTPDAAIEPSVKITMTDEAGKLKTVVLSETRTVKKGETTVVSVNAAPASAGFGVSAIRRAEVEFKVAGKVYKTSLVLNESASHLTLWQALGAFAYDVKQPLKAQKVKDLDAAKAIDLTKTFAGKNGKLVVWKRTAVEPDYSVDALKAFGEENACCYLATWIKSGAAQKAEFDLASDDGVEVWLNGKSIHLNDAYRPLSPVGTSGDKIAGQLQRGGNLLLIKLSQGAGGWGLRVKVKTEQPVEQSQSPLN